MGENVATFKVDLNNYVSIKNLSGRPIFYGKGKWKSTYIRIPHTQVLNPSPMIGTMSVRDFKHKTGFELRVFEYQEDYSGLKSIEITVLDAR